MLVRMISWRAASSLDDLRAAESLLSRAWLDDAPFADSHPGDLEWWYASVAPDELPAHLRVWDIDGAPLGWSWVTTDQVHWEIWSGDPSQDDLILEAVLRVASDETTGALQAWAAEDDPATIAILRRLGFVPGERRLSQFQRRIDDGPTPETSPPPGYGIRAVNGPDEIPARVEAHRAAFAPSRMTIEKYARLTTLPHYRFEDDLVVEAPDGSIAAFAMAWWDPVARIGEYEPVGTHPDHQRRGLGRALLSHGLHRYQELGARIVQVFSNTDNAASEGLYQAVGFERRRYRRLFERSRA
jgi:mycothiol synthase